MIIIIVAVIILVLLGISLNKPKTTTGVESYEIESFILASLQHTTECSTDLGFSYDSVGDLITECDFEQVCENGKTACETLNVKLSEIVKNSWQVGADRPVKGYVLNITSDNNEILILSDGNITPNYKENSQPLSRRGSDYSIDLKVYY